MISTVLTSAGQCYNIMVKKAVYTIFKDNDGSYKMRGINKNGKIYVFIFLGKMIDKRVEGRG